MTTRSIRRFLLSGTLLIVTGCLALSTLVGYLDASHELEELFDARLAQSARITNRLLDHYRQHVAILPGSGAVYQDWESLHRQGQDLAKVNDEASQWGHKYEGKLYFQQLDQNGVLLLRSPGAPEQNLGQLAPGFSYARGLDHDWRTFTLFDPAQHSWLIVAERDDVRGELASKMALRAIMPPLVALPFLLLLLYWVLARGLRPLEQLAQAISERHPANLSPLTLTPAVVELTPLTNEINRLLATVADTLEREKQFTNEAAHELKTPLAVLRIHVDNALAAPDPETRNQSLNKVLQAVERSDRLVHQLLTQARLDNQQDIELERLNLNELLRESLAALTPLALKKHQQLSFEPEVAARVLGQGTLLGLLFSNLIDNAIRYTPAGGQIQVILSKELDSYRVSILDNGPGIAAADLPRLWERFFRVNPQRGDGAGLGLAIARRIARLHHAGISVHNREQGGLAVTVRLPIPANGR